MQCSCVASACLCVYVLMLLAAGAAGVVILPVTGIVIGSIQIGRGIINQPEAIREARKGKFWDLVGFFQLCAECLCSQFPLGTG